jgi:DNA topoisomerase-1
MSKSLVIVESPAKARTINRYLGDDYDVVASMGHVRDLPKKDLAVDVENGFAPTYVTIEDKKQVVSDIKKAAKKADFIYIATDPDREGEAIGWHLLELLEDGEKPVFRVSLEEITKQGIERAFDSPTQVDMNKVDAQQARRVLDRLVGYKLSPLLWDKVRRGISAGRVQSVALRLVVDREREIQAFKPEEYWSIVAQLEADEPPQFEAELRRKEGEKIEIPDGPAAMAILSDLGVENPKEESVAQLCSAAAEPAGGMVVSKVEAKERRRKPQPPFTTSTLQQGAYRRLRSSVRRTMALAQQLYEGVDIGEEGTVGLITYMRTDSTRTSTVAQKEAQEVVSQIFGAEYATKKPRVYKSRKGAQEAHEAIRPTSVARTPDKMRRYLDDDQFKLYDLIWRRFVASQMRDAIYDTTAVDIEAGAYLFRAKGSVLKFPGFLAAYEDPKRKGNRKAGEEEKRKGEADDALLPRLEEGQTLKCLGLIPRQHFTQPPPRFTEGTLVRELERNGIGRPSTYAAILSTLRNRDYVTVEKRRFTPTELGTVVVDLLVDSFNRIMDIQYTAKVENRLDLIESGEQDWVAALERFWKRFSGELDKAQAEMRDVKREEIPTEEVCDKCGKPMVIKWGRFGRFLACTGYPECKNTKQIKANGDGDKVEVDEPEPTGEQCPKCGADLVRRRGRYGLFVGCSGYPDCRYIQPKTTGVKCPDCGGELVEKRSRRGRTFFGCDQYPDCEFATWKKPVPIACPSCKHPFLETHRRKGQPETLVCPNKECDFVTEPEAAETTA